MIKLVEIKAKKNNHYQLTFNIEQKEETHLVSENVMFKCNLFKTRELEKKEYKDIIHNILYDNLYMKAIHFISYQMRTISEVKKKLKKDTTDSALIDSVITELKNKRYISDDQYVKEYITQKIEFDLVGPRYIKEKLIGKGIHFDLIDKYLIQYEEKHQYDKVCKIIENETKYPIKKPYTKVYLSLKTKLINKGFAANIVESSLQSMKDQIKQAVNDDDLLLSEFKKLQKRYDVSDWNDKDKVVKSLMSKGFDYQRIKRLFD